MAKYPRTEAEIRILAQKVIIGITENPDFPSPPVSASDLNNLLTSLSDLSESQVVTQAAAEHATDLKQAGVEALNVALKRVLRYLEDAAQGDESKLTALGWGYRSAATPLTIPGQTRLFEVLTQGSGYVTFDWKRPIEGGEVTYYEIFRRKRSEGDWVQASSSILTERTLNNQERGVELEYYVVAMNRAGEGVPSNIVSVVL